VSVRKSKDGKTWITEVRIRKDSVRVRRTSSTKKEALKKEAEIRAEVDEYRVPEIGIEKALENYLTGEALTLKDYGSIKSKARAILPYISQRTFSDVGRVSDEIKRSMLDKGLKPATINRRLALLRRLANLAYTWGWIDTPEGKRVKLLSGEKERHYYLTIDQVNNFIAECPTMGVLIKIAAYTGLRRGELFKITDEMLSDNFISLPNDTKTGKPRLVPIPDQIKEDINNQHWPLDKSFDWELRKEFEAARKILSLDHIRFHDLRHTYASLLAQSGATLQLIGKAMGHSTPVMTNRYAHLVADNLQELADRLSKIN